MHGLLQTAAPSVCLHGCACCHAASAAAAVCGCCSADPNSAKMLHPTNKRNFRPP